MDFKIKLFADGADRETMLRLNEDPIIQGFTTNPTLLRKAGVNDPDAFARGLLAEITEKPISFEVTTDDLREMEHQAKQIASWGPNVYVKIPITNTANVTTARVIRKLSWNGVKVNVTAVMTLDQVRIARDALVGGADGIISVFAGRIADTLRDPVPLIQRASEVLFEYPKIELLWASTREVLNIQQAEAAGCHIITVTPDILKKLELYGKDLEQYSLETVRMFYQDAHAAA